MEYVVDVQGFKRPLNAFTFKEIAVTPLGEEDAVPVVFLIQPPYSWDSLPIKFRCENSWLIRNFHGIPWEAGEIPYADVQEVLLSALQGATKVWVKGLEKKKWLGRLVPDVYNLEDLGCPSLSRLGNKKKWCSHHAQCPQPVCAAHNVEVLKELMVSKSKYFSRKS